MSVTTNIIPFEDHSYEHLWILYKHVCAAASTVPSYDNINNLKLKGQQKQNKKGAHFNIIIYYQHFAWINRGK